MQIDKIIEKVERDLKDEFNINCAYQKYIGKITFDDLFTIDSIILSAKKCSKGFMHKRDTQVFVDNLYSNSYELLQRLKNNSFTPTYFKETVLKERGKLRKIKPPTFECKVVQKVICDYLIRPILEQKMITTNYASVKGRGVHKMYTDIQKALDNANKDYVIVMTDFRNYFGSIDLELFKKTLNRYMNDEKIVSLVNMFFIDDVSLGNEISQVPASFYPNSLDHSIKDKLRIKYYFRFMDDTLAVIHKCELDEYIRNLKKESARLKLEIKSVEIINYGKSFKFCKEEFNWNGCQYYRKLNPQFKRNAIKRLKAYHRLGKAKKLIEDYYKTTTGILLSKPNTKLIQMSIKEVKERLEVSQ